MTQTVNHGTRAIEEWVGTSRTGNATCRSKTKTNASKGGSVGGMAAD